MRKTKLVTISLTPKTCKLLKKYKEKTGIPISTALERSFLEMYKKVNSDENIRRRQKKTM